MYKYYVLVHKACMGWVPAANQSHRGESREAVVRVQTHWSQEYIIQAVTALRAVTA